MSLIIFVHCNHIAKWRTRNPIPNTQSYTINFIYFPFSLILLNVYWCANRFARLPCCPPRAYYVDCWIVSICLFNFNCSLSHCLFIHYGGFRCLENAIAIAFNTRMIYITPVSNIYTSTHAGKRIKEWKKHTMSVFNNRVMYGIGCVRYL